MIVHPKYIFYLFLLLSILSSEPFTIKPLIFINHSSGGNDWVYDNEPITNFGAGFNLFVTNQLWTIEAQYIQLGFLGKINNELYNQLNHPIQELNDNGYYFYSH